MCRIKQQSLTSSPTTIKCNAISVFFAMMSCWGTRGALTMAPVHLVDPPPRSIGPDQLVHPVVNLSHLAFVKPIVRKGGRTDSIGFPKKLTNRMLLEPRGRGTQLRFESSTLIFIRGWVALSLKVCESVRASVTPDQISTFPINAIHWPNNINYRFILTQYRQVPTISVLYWPM